MNKMRKDGGLMKTILIGCRAGRFAHLRQGESLLSFARRNGVSVFALLCNNPCVHPLRLIAGQVLIVPLKVR